MASNWACVGLPLTTGDELGALLEAVMPTARQVDSVNGVDVYRWQDDSGARLVVYVEDGAIVDVLPSFAATGTTRVGDVVARSGEIVSAAILDDDGEQLTAAAFRLEQRPMLANRTIDAAAAHFVFLCGSVTVHADDAAFAASPASLLVPGAEDDDPPPENVVESGLKRPLRFGSDSFISYGVFGDPADAPPVARFGALVRSAERRTNTALGQSFVVAAANIVGIEATLCLSGQEFPDVPVPGQVIAGEAYLVASISDLESPPRSAPRRRLWRRAGG